MITAPGQLGATSLVTYNWNPTSQLTHFLAAVASVAAGTAGATARIVTFGDSTTEGINADGSDGAGALYASYPADLTDDLEQDSGLPVQNANFQGEDIDNGVLSFVGPGFSQSTAYSGLPVAGGSAITTTQVGQGFDFRLATAGNYDTLSLNYYDSGSGTVTIIVGGGSAPTVTQTLKLGNSGNFMTHTITLPAGSYGEVSVVADDAIPTFLEGASFSNSAAPAIQIFNAGVGGATSQSAGNGLLTGAGEFPGGLELAPSLALLDYGINDIINNLFTPAQTAANFATMITECRAAGCDPVIVIPTPFGLNPYLTMPQITTLAAVRTGLEALAVAQNVAIIDLSATYGDSFQALSTAGLLNSPHPDAALYADIASRIAVLLSGDPRSSFANTSSYVVAGTQSVQGTGGNDILFGGSTYNTLIGQGGYDTYVMHALDQTDTIVNASAASAAPSGQLDITSASHDLVWLQQSGADLVVRILGSTQEAIVQNWYGATASQLQTIVADDGYTIGAGIQGLVQATADFAAANPGFNPATDVVSTSDTGAAAFEAAEAAAWKPQVACFVAGTRIRTRSGAIAVEHLAAGDQVITWSGALRPIVWLGRRRIEADHPRLQEVAPVRIRAGAFAASQPVRDLLVSPDHAVFVGDVLIPIRTLVNDTTILREIGRAVDYWHIELETHDIIFAEDLPTESWLDTGNRSMFENAPINVSAAYGRSCAPVVESGCRIERVRAALAGRAATIGQPLHGILDVVIPTPGSRHFKIPPGTRAVRLLSTSRVPGRDRRRLGAALRWAAFDGEGLALDGNAFGLGFYAAEGEGSSRWRWTDGAGTIALRPRSQAGVLTIDVQTVLGS